MGLQVSGSVVIFKTSGLAYPAKHRVITPLYSYVIPLVSTMTSDNMAFKVNFLSGSVRAEWTGIRFLSSVGTHMPRQVELTILASKSSTTHGAKFRR